MSTEEPAPCEDCRGNLAKHEKGCKWDEGASEEELSAIDEKTKTLQKTLDEYLDEHIELPCARTPDLDPDGTPAWNCDNDHTGCLWNDGNNTCMHEGNDRAPLEVSGPPPPCKGVPPTDGVCPLCGW